MDVNIWLFEDFETLDVFGPVEVFGRLSEKYQIKFYSFSGGEVKSKQNAGINTLPYEQMDTEKEYILLIPGGQGTRPLVKDEEQIEKIKELAEKAKYVLTVCTGSAVLAKTGLLDGKEATSNKMAFTWVKSVNEKVRWLKKARWVDEGKYYSSSGISAGIDMALGFIETRDGKEAAEKTAKEMEYLWNEDKDDDPFAAP